jgi:putative phosphoesterase
MTRLAIISDLHGDLYALDDALAAIDAMACDLIVCAGDLVDFGLFPDETIARLAERRIPTIRGNHDRWASPSRRRDGSTYSGGWDLSRASRSFLDKLPTSLELTIDGTRVAIHHASPRGDMDGLLVDDMTHARARGNLSEARADALIVGHTHLPFVVHLDGGQLIANPGALLREAVDSADGPRRDPSACFTSPHGSFAFTGRKTEP